MTSNTKEGINKDKSKSKQRKGKQRLAKVSTQTKSGQDRSSSFRTLKLFKLVKLMLAINKLTLQKATRIFWTPRTSCCAHNNLTFTPLKWCGCAEVLWGTADGEMSRMCWDEIIVGTYISMHPAAGDAIKHSKPDHKSSVNQALSVMPDDTIWSLHITSILLTYI